MARRPTQEVETILEAGEETTEEINIRLRPARLPELRIVDERGVSTSQCVGLIDLLTLIDKSSIVDTLLSEDTKRTTIPKLPERVILADVLEHPEVEMVVVTGWVPEARYAFTLRASSLIWHIELPPIVYTAQWIKKRNYLEGLDITILDPLSEIDPHEESKLYRWPFSNVYTHGKGTGVCWYTMKNVKMELNEIPRLGVGGFLNVPNVPDLYGVGISQNSKHTSLEEYMTHVQEQGLDPQYMIPHDETPEMMHERRATEWQRRNHA